MTNLAPQHPTEYRSCVVAYRFVVPCTKMTFEVTAMCPQPHQSPALRIGTPRMKFLRSLDGAASRRIVG